MPSHMDPPHGSPKEYGTLTLLFRATEVTQFKC